jgi:XTP/dITP diphosphohydrolase
MTTLLIATRNAHKTGEIQTILGTRFHCLTLEKFPGAPTVLEDADTFAGNATKKATELAKWLTTKALQPQSSTISYVLADDSGLEVDALNGAPGVHSARFAALGQSADDPSSSPKQNSPDADNNAKLLRLLKDVPQEKRSARFRCVIALIEIHHPSAIGKCQIFDGECEGRIQLTASGDSGFGYDPLFVPDGFTQSFAELGDEAKNKISHRAKALETLKNYFKRLPI